MLDIARGGEESMQNLQNRQIRNANAGSAFASKMPGQARAFGIEKGDSQSESMHAKKHL
jgi:hypothetical protein